MKRTALILSAFLVLTAFTTTNNVWQSDKAHAQLGFTVTHLGIADVSGIFKDFEVRATSSKSDFSDAVFELNAKVASIDTRVEQRNAHLLSADFFDAEQYPSILFKSTSMKPSGKNKYKLSGNLTIRDITKPVTMDLVYRGSVEHPQSKVNMAGFQLTGTIKRSDFNVGAAFPGLIISDEVRIKADGEFTQK